VQRQSKSDRGEDTRLLCCTGIGSVWTCTTGEYNRAGSGALERADLTVEPGCYIRLARRGGSSEYGCALEDDVVVTARVGGIDGAAANRSGLRRWLAVIGCGSGMCIAAAGVGGIGAGCREAVSVVKWPAKAISHAYALSTLSLIWSAWRHGARRTTHRTSMFPAGFGRRDALRRLTACLRG